MQVQTKQLEKSQTELTITISVDEIKPSLAKAVEELSKEVKIDGFRPGKAPRNILEAKIGQESIWERAANLVVPKFLTKAIMDEKIDALGRPEINVVKLAPDNEFVFTAKIAVMPTFELGDYKNLKAKRKEVKVNEQELEKTIKHLQTTRAKSIAVNSGAQKGNEVKIDFEVVINGKAIEGGTVKGHVLIVGENKLIPGFEDNLIGVKRGEKKEFELTFPENYHQENLKGKKATFKIEMKDVFARELPEINDDFAKSLGSFKDLEGLKKDLRENIQKELETKEDDRYNLEIVEEISANTKVDLPEVLVAGEVGRMLKELEFSLMQQGGTMEDYLKINKKTREDLAKDFRVPAEKRVKTSLIIREIYQKENLKVTDAEVNAEIEKTRQAYANHPEAAKHLETDRYKEYLKETLANRKVFDYLKRGTLQN